MSGEMDINHEQHMHKPRDIVMLTQLSGGTEQPLSNRRQTEAARYFCKRNLIKSSEILARTLYVGSPEGIQTGG